MQNTFCGICVLSSLLVSVLSSNQTNLTTDTKIDPRIQLMPEGNDYQSDGNCPVTDVSVYMTGCWIGSFNVWQLNITDISANGVVRAYCQSSPDCDLKFCCAAYEAIRCFSKIGQHFCAPEFARMTHNFGKILNRVCDSVFEAKCPSIASISESKLQRVELHSRTDTNTSEEMDEDAIIQLIKEPEIQKITIQLKLNGSVGVVASVVTVCALLVVNALFI